MKYYEEWPSRCAAMAIYYAQKDYHAQESTYTDNLQDLMPFSKEPFPISEEANVSITLTDNGYEAKATLASYTATVNQERYLVVSTEKCTVSEM